MRTRTVIIGVLALVFGGSAALGVHLLRRHPGDGQAKDVVKVVVLKADLPRGGTIASDSLELRDWPKSLMPTGAITRTDEAVNRTVFIPLLKGEPLVESKLAPKGAGRGMAALIPPGMRAFTIQTAHVAAGVAGFILPGNKVDVLLTVSGNSADDPSGGGSTLTLLQNVEVLAIDQRVEAPAENKMDLKELRSVTLLVTPEQATRLDLGQNRGTLHLALRNPEDIEHSDTGTTTLAELRGTPEKKAEPAPTPPPPAAEPAPRPVSQVAFAQIRTLRGRHSGAVFIASPEPVASEPVANNATAWQPSAGR